jgi:hypothetical protein
MAQPIRIPFTKETQSLLWELLQTQPVNTYLNGTWFELRLTSIDRTPTLSGEENRKEN